MLFTVVSRNRINLAISKPALFFSSAFCKLFVAVKHEENVTVSRSFGNGVLARRIEAQSVSGNLICIELRIPRMPSTLA